MADPPSSVPPAATPPPAPAVPDWVPAGSYGDIRHETADGLAKITIARPEVRNAFRPQTVFELMEAFRRAQDDPEVGVVILTGEGPLAFCSGGDQRVRGDDGYMGDDAVAGRGIGRLNVLDLQVQIRRCPKPVVAMVAGYAIGGGNVLHVVCDLTIAADNARFGQTGPRVGSFDGGYGAGLLARMVGQKKAREIWFLCRQYDAAEALAMGLVNAVVPLADLEAETVRWCREMLTMSPLALRMLKASLNAVDDGLAGIQQLAGDATLLYYMSEEAQEGRDAYVERRPPDFSQFPRPAVSIWIAGARPRTLPASVVPVLVGTAVALDQGDVVPWRALAALVVAVAIQVGTNYANDYSDGIRGTDDVRVGPVRLVAGGLATAAAVKRAALASFAVAGVAGLALAAAAGPELVVVGAASLAAGWLYTGGPRPYGYAGFGEVFVFAFFGVVATVGSAYVHLERVSALALSTSVPVGLLATALLVVNNLRDIPTDTAVGKRTLAVRMGGPATRLMYVGCLAGAFASVPLIALRRPAALLALVALPLARSPALAVGRGAVGPRLIGVLIATGQLQLVFGLLLAVGIAL